MGSEMCIRDSFLWFLIDGLHPSAQIKIDSPWLGPGLFDPLSRGAMTDSWSAPSSASSASPAVEDDVAAIHLLPVLNEVFPDNIVRIIAAHLGQRRCVLCDKRRGVMAKVNGKWDWIWIPCAQAPRSQQDWACAWTAGTVDPKQRRGVASLPASTAETHHRV